MSSAKHPPPPTDSLPGDLIGKDAAGRVRIDRVIPLPWVLGIIGAGVMNAAAMYYGQRQLIEAVAELKTDVRGLVSGVAASVNRDTEHSLRIQALERRVDQLETRK